MKPVIFVHGLESSSQGSKASWFRGHFPEMIIPNFRGALSERLESLDAVLAGCDDLIMIGSSFGGLMATIFALEKAERVRRLILLAPALNFPDFAKYHGRVTTVPARLYIGSKDTVCPPTIVVPVASEVFTDLIVDETDDDHLLRKTFNNIRWRELLEH